MIILVLLASLGFSVFAPQTFDILGTVRDNTGRPVNGVRVSLMDENQQPIRTELTNTSDITGFAVVQISCGAAGAEDPIDFVTTGGTSLRYSGTPGSDGQFIQNWQTPKAAGNCYRVTMTARDATTISALFKTK